MRRVHAVDASGGHAGGEGGYSTIVLFAADCAGLRKARPVDHARLSRGRYLCKGKRNPTPLMRTSPCITSRQPQSEADYVRVSPIQKGSSTPKASHAHGRCNTKGRLASTEGRANLPLR
jgi:hypothetical protein